MSTEPNYTDAQVARIERAADENGGAIDKDIAAELAEESIFAGKSARAIIAKASNMGVYRKAVKQSVNGGPVERKADIAKDIENILGQNLDGLDMAPMVALKRLRTFARNAVEETAEAA